MGNLTLVSLVLLTSVVNLCIAGTTEVANVYPRRRNHRHHHKHHGYNRGHKVAEKVAAELVERPSMNASMAVEGTTPDNVMEWIQKTLEMAAMSGAPAEQLRQQVYK